MNKISRAWSDAAYEVHVHSMEKCYGSDLQREPPMVSDKLPGYHVFSWRLPTHMLPGRLASTAKQVWYFVTIFIGDLWWPLVCRFRKHVWQDDSTASPEHGYMGVTCQRCGQHRGSWLY